MTLAGERCTACRPGSPMVAPEEETALHQYVPDWEIVEAAGVRKLRRTFRIEGWMPAMRFADRIAEVAEMEDHHPTMTISWGKVTVTWWTHAIGGLHRNDFVMASRVDELFTTS